MFRSGCVIFVVMEIRKNIEGILREKSLTIPLLAIKLGCTSSNLYVQLGKEYPSLRTLSRIAEALGVPLSELLKEGEGEGPGGFRCPVCGAKLGVVERE